jgi:DNA helicase-2/ATP-dependent DNA helicase PcrA
VSQEPSVIQQEPASDLYSFREKAILDIRNRLRPGQQQMADWESGQLAVCAVPGAGKSTGMAAAVAIAIARQHQSSASLREAAVASTRFLERRQLVVVTFTRSAAANIKAKICKYLKELSLPPTGFAVYTLHGLALNIASRHPELSGLPWDDVTLITPTTSHRVLRNTVEQWIYKHPQHYGRLIEGIQFDGEETERLRRQSVLRTEVLPELATTVIHEAKSSGLFPEDLQRLSEQTRDDYGILSMAAGLYEQYQNLMRSRDLIDYDDMILAALRVLENPSARQIEQNQVFAVFEDEAQDSSPLQTKLLKILASDSTNPHQPPNLIRVGDPNQAINSTFTPADPIYFRQFCEDCKTQNRLATMDRAGRSTKIIIDAANFVLEWVNAKTRPDATQVNSFPSPFRPQKIHPVSSDDPQTDANPQPEGRGLEICTPDDIYHTVELLSQRIVQLFAQDPTKISAAILVRENRQGRWLAEKLSPICKQQQITLYDVGERDRHSHVPQEILTLLQFCDRPHSPDYLKAVLEVFVERQLIPTQDLNVLASAPENFLYPGPLCTSPPEPVQKAARLCRSLLRARLELPLYQLIPFFALTLNYDQAELATADKLAERINQQIGGNTSMGTMLDTLNEIVSSERFEPVETEDLEARYTRCAQLTIITMHKAKGLDWDCVFIPFLHENIIPGKFWLPPQARFLGNFTLSEIARAQIRANLHGQSPLPDIDQAWKQAKYLKTAEEYRLLYVAITRAKRLLWISAAQKAPFSWGKPENLQPQPPCPVFSALKQQFPECVL